MDIPITQSLPCGHDPTSVIIVAERIDQNFRFRCTECGAESRKRAAPEWFWKALAEDSEETGTNRHRDAPSFFYTLIPHFAYV